MDPGYGPTIAMRIFERGPPRDQPLSRQDGGPPALGWPIPRDSYELQGDAMSAGQQGGRSSTFRRDPPGRVDVLDILINRRTTSRHRPGLPADLRKGGRPPGAHSRQDGETGLRMALEPDVDLICAHTGQCWPVRGTGFEAQGKRGRAGVARPRVLMADAERELEERQRSSGYKARVATTTWSPSPSAGRASLGGVVSSAAPRRPPAAEKSPKADHSVKVGGRTWTGQTIARRRLSGSR